MIPITTKHILIVILIYFTISVNLFGQSTVYIQGKVFDSKTQLPIPFSFITLNQNKLGIIANEEGDFKININPKFLSDTLKISCIGYDQKLIKYSELSAKNVNNFYLNPAVIQLKEVQISGLNNKNNTRNNSNRYKKISAKKLIKKAIENIPNNYAITPFSHVSYYRDYQKKDKEYLNLNEAIIHTYDNGFTTDDVLNDFRLLNYKTDSSFVRNNLFLLYDTIDAPNYENPNKFIPNAYLPNQGGNELFILLAHDPIRNYKSNSFSFINVFSKNFLENHNFSKIEPVYNNDLLLFKIKFTTKPYIERGLVTASGEIFIQPKDYSIHKISYTCLNSTTNKEIFNFKIEYGYTQQTHSTMRLKYLSFNNLFNVIDEKDSLYFKILKREVHNSYVEFKMNKLVDENSVNNKDFYVFLGDGNRLKTESILVKDSTVVINFNNKKNYIEIECIINTSNFKDIEGNRINQKKLLEYYQYRELFVQEYNAKIQFKDSCYLGNNPLFNSCISKFSGENNYWMNTPVGIKDEKD